MHGSVTATRPINSLNMYFDELNLNDNILDALDDMRFETCTPIQEKCIPEILDGHDLLGIAQTGTGKTAAYLLPILSLLDDGYYPTDANNCVIMSPTRELAQQIDKAMQGFGYYLENVSSVAVYGGNDGNRYDQEMKGLKLGADVIIATPGRLISHINMGNVDLMFSATMPPKIEQLAKTLLKNPVEVKLAVSKPADNIRQMAYVCHDNQKLAILRDLFKKQELHRVIIFSGHKSKVKDITRDLLRMHVNCGEMHSDLDQSQRDEMMHRFKSGQIDVLVATDIVARGIDIDDIETVINYDVPHDAEDYVHRIGRTARANRTGTAITLVRGREIGMFMQIEKFLERTIEKLPLPEGVGEGPEYKPMPVRGRGGRRPAKRNQKRRGKAKTKGTTPKDTTPKASTPKAPTQKSTTSSGKRQHKRGSRSKDSRDGGKQQ